MKTLTIFRSKWMFMVGIVVFLPLVGGCQEEGLPDKVQSLDDAYAVIVGEWEWTKSLLIDRRVGTIVQTPESEGLAKQIVFGRNRTMRIIENGTVVRDSEYIIEAHEGIFLLRLVDTGGSSGMRFKADTLVLYSPVFGDNHYYIRK